MGKKRSKHKKPRKARSKGPPPAPAKPKPAVAWGIFAWGLVMHLIYLQAGSVLSFFFGDALYYLQKAGHLAAGTSLDADLPFHPPLVAWLLTPLAWLTSSQTAVYTAAKVLMAAFNAATYAGLYLLLRPRVPWATYACLLMPLSFGELLLSATPNSEAVYRLLLVALLLVGWRWPAAGGVLHGLAALTRAEHAIAGLVLLALGLARPERRRFAAVTGLVAAAVLLPYTIAVSLDLRAYNADHAETLPEPLPTIVPVSFYGPLNFALAQTEDGIHFSRRTLPASQGEAAALDPNHPKHNDYIVHGYRIGLAAIWDDPGRFLARSLSKLGHSARAFTYGWTWRDLPKGSTWTRQPVDMASASAPAYEILMGLAMALGAWHLRRDRWLLGIGFAFVAYRLAINVAFFPYLRSMTIAAPFVLVLLVAGLAAAFKHLTPRVLGTIVLFLALFHLVTGLGDRKYLEKGERDERGAVIEDRPVILKYDGPS